MLSCSLRRRLHLTLVGHAFEAAPRSLFLASNRFNELPEMRFEFPFNLIGKSTMAFQQTNHGAYWNPGTQSVVPSVAQARSLVEQAFRSSWRLPTNTRRRFTAQHKLFSVQLLINAVVQQTLSPLSSFAGGKCLRGQLSMGRIPCGCLRENVECGPETANGTRRLSTSVILRSARKYNWARVLDLVTRCLTCYLLGFLAVKQDTSFLFPQPSSHEPWAMFTLYLIAFTPPRKPYRIGLLFTLKNSDFGAISVTKRSCAAPISKVQSYIIIG